MKKLPVPCFVLAWTAACAASGGRVEISVAPAAPGVPAVEEVRAVPVAREASAPVEPEPVAVAARAEGELSDAELALWNDPGFQRRFTESYIAATDIEPSVTVVERDLMQEALGLMSANKLERALAQLEKGRNDASSAVLDFTIANIHFQRDELEQAVTAYELAVKKFPRFRRAWGNLGLCQARLAHFPQAIEAFTRVIEQGGGDSATFGLLGIAHSNLGNFLAAESAFRMAALLDPSSADWKMGLAQALFKQERFSDAVALCREMIQAQPERAELWLLQANAYARLGQPLEAAQNLELVDRLGKSTAESLYLLGDIYTNDQLFDLAAETYGRAMDKDAGKRPERAIHAAQALGARGAHQETAQLVARIEAAFGAGLEDAQRRELLHLRVKIAVAQGASGEEVRALEEIVALDPLDGEALILLGQNAGRAGDAEKAVFYYERAEGIEATEADARIRHAQLLVGQGKYAEALPLLRRAQTLKPRENVQQYLEQVEKVAQGR